MWLGRGLFVENDFPTLCGVVRFNFSVGEIKKRFSVLNGNIHNLVEIDETNVLVTCGYNYAGVCCVIGGCDKKHYNRDKLLRNKAHHYYSETVQLTPT